MIKRGGISLSELSIDDLLVNVETSLNTYVDVFNALLAIRANKPNANGSCIAISLDDFRMLYLSYKRVRQKLNEERSRLAKEFEQLEIEKAKLDAKKRKAEHLEEIDEMIKERQLSRDLDIYDDFGRIIDRKVMSYNDNQQKVESIDNNESLQKENKASDESSQVREEKVQQTSEGSNQASTTKSSSGSSPSSNSELEITSEEIDDRSLESEVSSEQSLSEYSDKASESSQEVSVPISSKEKQAEKKIAEELENAGYFTNYDDPVDFNAEEDDDDPDSYSW